MKILVGELVGYYGTKGFFKLRSFCSPLENIFHYPLYDENLNKILVEFKIKKNNTNFIVAANTQKLVKLYTLREFFKEDINVFYISDLINLDVEDLNGSKIGRVNYIHNFGARDVIEIALDDSKTVFFPFDESIKILDRKIIIDQEKLLKFL